jgi:hypothetical protein
VICLPVGGRLPLVGFLAGFNKEHSGRPNVGLAAMTINSGELNPVIHEQGAGCDRAGNCSLSQMV